MKWTVAIVTVVVGVTGLCRADDARRTFDDRDRCLVPDGVSPEQKLESCTVVIQSAGQTRQVLVAAYNDRGVVYASKRDYARAIADYDQALTSDLDDPYLTEVRQSRERALAATATPPK